MNSQLIQPLELINQLGLIAKINKKTLRFKDKVVDSSFSQSEKYIQKSVLRFYAFPTIPLAITTIVIQHTQAWYVHLINAASSFVYLILLYSLPKYTKNINRIYIFVQIALLNAWLILILNALKNDDIPVPKKPTEYYLQGFMIASYFFIFMQCLQDIHVQIVSLSIFMMIAVFYGEIFAIDWPTGVRILMICLFSGGIIYIKELYLRVIYLLNCHSLKMLNRFRNIIYSDLPNAIIVLENDDQQKMNSLFHNKAYEEIFMQDFKQDESSMILQRVTLSNQPQLTLIDYIKQRMALNASFQNPVQMFGLQHDNNVEREYFYLENCMLIVENSGEASSNKQKVKHIDVKCVRAFWEEKQSFVLILEDCQKKLTQAQKIQRKIATEILQFFQPSLKVLHQLFQQSVSDDKLITKVAMQNLEYLQIIQKAFEQINTQEDVSVSHERGEDAQKSAKQLSSRSYNLDKNASAEVRIPVRKQCSNVAVSIQAISQQISSSQEEQKDQIFKNEIKEQQPSYRRNYETKAQFFTVKHLSERLFNGSTAESISENGTDTTVLQVISDDNRRVYNDENKVIALITLCVQRLKQNLEGMQHIFEVRLKFIENIVLFTVCLTRSLIPKANSLAHSSQQIEVGFQKQLEQQQVNRNTQNTTFRQLCRTILAEIGPKMQRVSINTTGENTIEFVIYNQIEDKRQQNVFIEESNYRLERAQSAPKILNRESSENNPEEDEVAEERKSGELPENFTLRSFDRQNLSIYRQVQHRQVIVKHDELSLSDIHSMPGQLNKYREVQILQFLKQNQNNRSLPLLRQPKELLPNQEKLSYSAIRGFLSYKGSVMQQPGLAKAKFQRRNRDQFLQLRGAARSVLDQQDQSRGQQSDDEDGFKFCDIQK